MPRRGGRSRSNSTSSYGETVPMPSTLTTGTLQNTPARRPSAGTLDACNALFRLVSRLPCSLGPGSNFLHAMAISDDRDGDFSVNELSIRHVLLSRAAKVDRANRFELKAGGGGRVSTKKQQKVQTSSATKRLQQESHLRTLLLSVDSESMYNPLHSCMYQRRLRPTLLLLRHAALAALEDGDGESFDDGRIKTHPILMLNGDSIRKKSKHFHRSGSSGLTNAAASRGSGDILIDMVLARDAEGLTPLNLLSKSMSSDLARCRRYLAQHRLDAIGGKNAANMDRSNNLIDDGGHSDDGHNDLIGGRMRGTSFGNVHDVDLDADGPVAGNELLRPSGNDFDALQGTGREEDLVDGEGESDDTGTGAAAAAAMFSQTPIIRTLSSPCSYGCEVMTFGRADHCALGVPHFSSRRADTTTGKPAVGDGAKGGGSAVRPRRVEAFALGEMNRQFEDEDGVASSPSSTIESHGTAVAVAAAAHHTLVATAKGHLLSFGLGLGTGDENHRPLPTRVQGPLARRRVVSIAAAVNHSLCSTSDGSCYAWGSNRFGQLSASTESSSCLPRRVTAMRNDFVVSVAAGDRHSVALTRRGEVYCWGDNRAGQLGMALRGERRKNGSPGSNSSSDRPSRVDALWKSIPKRKVALISAAEESTLVLVLPTRHGETNRASSFAVNSVYSWGHGNPVPVKVNFPPDATGKAINRLHRSGEFSGVNVNPIRIAAAKYHNVCVTSDGLVYTWGLHSEPLGVLSGGDDCSGDWESTSDRKRTSSVGSMVIASPQLVSGMLPENGGGLVVDVSASESSTAVVTADGHVYTWGSNEKSDILGHEGVKWQPIPRRIPGVHRAVGISVAREHTALLIGTSFPSIPAPSLAIRGRNGSKQSDGSKCIPSLQDLATQSIAGHMDLFNAIPLLITAERLGSKSMIAFCTEFIHYNLDGCLALSKKKHLDMLLDESLTPFLCQPDDEDERDASLHPLILALARADSGLNGKVSENWMEKCSSLVQMIPLSTLSKASYKRAAVNTTSRDTFADALGQSEVESATKRLGLCVITEKATPKKVHLIETTPENTASELEKKGSKDEDSKLNAASKSQDDVTPLRYRCELCNIFCPDEKAWSLHMGGKKHRNREQQAEEREKKEAVQVMLASKRKQMLETNEVDSLPDKVSAASPCKKDSEPIQPKYRLKPPSPPMYESKRAAVVTAASSKKSGTGEILSWSPPPKAAPKSFKAPTNFQQILEEEQTAAVAAKKKTHVESPMKVKALSSAWLPPIRKGSTTLSKPATTSSGVKISLGSFLEPKAKVPKRTGPAWDISHATGSPAKTPTVPEKESRQRKASFSEIQRREEELKAKQDGMCATTMEGKWYVERRERAASISAIAEEELEMQRLVEEQLAIEAQIKREQEMIRKEGHKKKAKEHNIDGNGKGGSKRQGRAGGNKGQGDGGGKQAGRRGRGRGRIKKNAEAKP